jgi:hypothetical protein
MWKPVDERLFGTDQDPGISSIHACIIIDLVRGAVLLSPEWEDKPHPETKVLYCF